MSFINKCSTIIRRSDKEIFKFYIDNIIKIDHYDKDNNLVAKCDTNESTDDGKLVFELTDAKGNAFKKPDPAGGQAQAINTNIELKVENANLLNGTGLADPNKKVVVDIKGKTDDLNLDLQVGANTGDSEKLNINIKNMSTDSLGLSKDDLKAITNDDLSKGTEASKKLIEKLDTALEKINTNRSNLGAVQNRLETSQSNLTTSTENLTAAESRIRDVDVAKEMVKLSKLNILNQASQAMVSQAKQQPESVSQLLR